MYEFYLMHETTQVLKFAMTIDAQHLSGPDIIEIVNSKYLPYAVKLCTNKSTAFYYWFKFRCMSKEQEGFAEFTTLLANSGRKFEENTPLFCSLPTYFMSLFDHYWINPAKEYEFKNIVACSDISFSLSPTTYEVAKEKFMNWDSDIEKVQLLTFVKDWRAYRDINVKELSLISPAFTSYGDKMKIWRKENGEIVCEKYFEKVMRKLSNYLVSPAEADEMNRRLEFSSQKEGFKHFVIYENASDYSIKSKYFLKENEEFVSFEQFLMADKFDKTKITDMSIYKFLRPICLDAKMYKEYLKERDALKEKFGITDVEFWKHLGFIIDSKSQAIKGIMNTL